MTTQMDFDDDDESPRTGRGVVTDHEAAVVNDRLAKLLDTHQLQDPDDFASADRVAQISAAITDVLAGPDFEPDLDSNDRYDAAFKALIAEATRRRSRAGLATIEDLNAHLAGNASAAARDRVRNSLATAPNLPPGVALTKIRAELQAKADQAKRADEERAATNQRRIDELQSVLDAGPQAGVLIEIYLATISDSYTAEATAQHWGRVKAGNLFEAIVAHVRIRSDGREPDFIRSVDILTKSYCQIRGLRYEDAGGVVRLLDPFPAALARSKK
jgi:hypothetical protein